MVCYYVTMMCYFGGLIFIVSTFYISVFVCFVMSKVSTLVKWYVVYIIFIVFASRFERMKSGEHAKKQDKISKVKGELEGAINVMRNNLTKVLDRGDKLEDLEAKSGNFTKACISE